MNREPERPRAEPEIIPPDRARAERASGDPRVFVYVDREGRTHRLNISAPRPLTVILALLIFALVSALILALLLGAFLIWLPIAAVLIATFMTIAFVRGFWHRLRGR
ncbi:MAG TPA: hypothetical protein VHG27_08700 [Xanthobacteraceae bacterium]|nr:hypothetical protein [Xanthobacteraceae bacterium]